MHFSHQSVHKLFFLVVLGANAVSATGARAQDWNPSYPRHNGGYGDLDSCRGTGSEINLGGISYGRATTLDLRQLLNLGYGCTGVAISAVYIEAQSDDHNNNYGGFAQMALLVDRYQTGSMQRVNDYVQTYAFSPGYRNRLDQDIHSLELSIDGNVRIYRVRVLYDMNQPGYPTDPGCPRRSDCSQQPGSAILLGHINNLSSQAHGYTLDLRNRYVDFGSIVIANNSAGDVEVTNVAITYANGAVQNEYVGNIYSGTTRRVQSRSSGNSQIVSLEISASSSFYGAHIEVYGDESR